MASPRRIRVAFFLDSFAIGGTELNAIRTAEALDPRRIELSVFHLQTRGPLRSRYEQLGVPMTHVPISSLYSIRTAFQGMRLAGMLRSRSIDVAHSHDIYCNIFAVPWARLLGRCATIASRRWGRQASRMSLTRINRWSSMLADRILANSRGVAELLACEENVPREKIIEIPNFLAESAFEVTDLAQRAAKRKALGIPDGAFAVGIVARLSPVKNHPMLLKAIAGLDERFHLVVIGDGPLRADLEDMAQQLGIGPRVHFLGEVISSRNLHECLDVSVLCSFSEGFPNSLIEAMAASRPVIATPVGGVGDAVTHGVTGIIVPVDDVASLAEALRMLQADSQLRTRLGDAGRDAVRLKFRQGAVIEKLSELYEQLATRRPTESSGYSDG
jgi:glycosyltransferase involved in cell wall biosynthesis